MVVVAKEGFDGDGLGSVGVGSGGELGVVVLVVLAVLVVVVLLIVTLGLLVASFLGFEAGNQRTESDGRIRLGRVGVMRMGFSEEVGDCSKSGSGDCWGDCSSGSSDCCGVGDGCDDCSSGLSGDGVDD